LAEVAAKRPASKRAARRHLELCADLVARRLACSTLGDERGPRLEDERLDLLRCAPDHRRDLGMAQIPELEQDKGAALVLGQAGEVGDELAQVGAPADVVGEAVAARLDRVQRQVAVAARREHRAAAVARDREQPRPDGLGRSPVAQRAVSADERLLERVLAVLAAGERMAAEGEQRGVMPVVERCEGRLVSGAHEGREALVIEPAESMLSQ
jgi:hypothetical protein